MSAKKKLEPVDRRQCQTDIPRKTNFMTMGGTIGGYVRCTNKPVYIATEKKASGGYPRGSMSLCEHCLGVFKKQMPAGFATFTPIRKSRAVGGTHD